MHPTIAAIKNALGYAKFSDGDVKDATLNLVTQLGDDLDPGNVDYEPGSMVEAAQKELEEALNNTDSSSEDTDDAIRNASTEDDDEDEAAMSENPPQPRRDESPFNGETR
jgi:hypothetical protein